MATPHAVQVAVGAGIIVGATAVLLRAVPIRLVKSAAKALTICFFASRTALIDFFAPQKSPSSDTSPQVSTSGSRPLQYAQLSGKSRHLVRLPDDEDYSEFEEAEFEEHPIEDCSEFEDFPSNLKERLKGTPLSSQTLHLISKRHSNKRRATTADNSGCSYCVYSAGCMACRNCDVCLGCTNCINCETCRDCLDCNGCIGCGDCTDCYDCTGCVDSTDCEDCIGCVDCHECFGLRNARGLTGVRR